MVKNLPAMQKTWVRSLGWKDPQEEEMAIYSSILAWKIPWTEEPGGLHSIGLHRVGHNYIAQTKEEELWLGHWGEVQGQSLLNCELVGGREGSLPCLSLPQRRK